MSLGWLAVVGNTDPLPFVESLVTSEHLVNRLELAGLVCIEEPEQRIDDSLRGLKACPRRTGRNTPSNANSAAAASRSRAFKASFKARTVVAVVSFSVLMLKRALHFLTGASRYDLAQVVPARSQRQVLRGSR